jgi:hypothetical protein
VSEFASLPPVRRQDGAKIHALLAPRHCQRARNVLVPDDCAEEMPPCRSDKSEKVEVHGRLDKTKNVESHSPRQNRNKLIQHVRHDQTVRISGALRAWRLRGKVNAILSISHRWMLPTQPDPDGKQLEAIKAFLVSSAGKRIELVWIDGGSMPQHQPEIGLIRSDEDKDDFDTMLSQVCAARFLSHRPFLATLSPPLNHLC